MTRFRWLSTALAIPAMVLCSLAAEPPSDPLPEGAKFRLGTSRGRYFGGFTPVPPEYKQAIVAEGYGGATLVDLATGNKAGKFGNGKMPVPIVMSGDGKRYITTSFEGILVWDIPSAKEVAAFKGRFGYGTSPSISHDGALVATGALRDEQKKDQKIAATVWDVEKKAPLGRFEVIQNLECRAVISPDGKMLATWGFHSSEGNRDEEGTVRRTIQFWDVAKKSELSRVVVDGFGPGAIRFSPDGETVAVASDSGGEIKLLSAKTGKSSVTLFGRSGYGSQLEFSPDGKIVVCASSDGSLVRWSVSDGRKLDVTPSPMPQELRLMGVGFTSNERTVAWGMNHLASVVWEVPSGKVISPEGGHSDNVRSFAFVGKEIHTTSGSRSILKWDAATGKPTGTLPFGNGFSFGYSETKFSPDGSLIFANPVVYDVKAGQIALTIPSSNRASMMYPSADGTRVAVLQTEYSDRPKPAHVLVIDVANCRLLKQIEIPAEEAGQGTVAVTPDGSKLVTGLIRQNPMSKKSEFTIAGWDIKEGKKLGEVVLPGGYGSSAVVPASDNKNALVWTPEGQLIAVDFVAGKEGKTYTLGQRGVRPTLPPVFDKEGKRFAVASGANYSVGDATIRVVEWESGKVLNQFKGHNRMVTALCFSPDGRMLLSGSADTTALGWDLESGK